MFKIETNEIKEQKEENIKKRNHSGSAFTYFRESLLYLINKERRKNNLTLLKLKKYRKSDKECKKINEERKENNLPLLNPEERRQINEECRKNNEECRKINEERRKINEERRKNNLPLFNLTDISTVASRYWKDMSEEDKQIFLSIYHEKSKKNQEYSIFIPGIDLSKISNFENWGSFFFHLSIIKNDLFNKINAIRNFLISQDKKILVYKPIPEIVPSTPITHTPVILPSTKIVNTPIITLNSPNTPNYQINTLTTTNKFSTLPIEYEDEITLASMLNTQDEKTPSLIAMDIIDHNRYPNANNIFSPNSIRLNQYSLNYYQTQNQ